MESGYSPVQSWRSFTWQVYSAVTYGERGKQSNLNDASIPWASLRQSHIWMEILKVEKIYNLSKQANFLKHLTFSINCFPVPTFSYHLPSWHVCFHRRNSDLGQLKRLWWMPVYLQRMYTKLHFPECGRNKQQKVISLLRNLAFHFQ